MGEIGSGNNSSYPGALDTNAIPEVNSPAAGKTKARKEPIEDLTDAVIKIETELGTDPAGSLTDVKTFLQTQHQTDGTHKSTHGPHKWLDEQDYANFTAAVAAAANKTLVVARSINLDANTTIPVSVSLMPINPGIINANGYTLTINDPVVGNPIHQWLSGFTASQITIKGKIHAKWFGAKGDYSWATSTGTDDSTALQLACDIKGLMGGGDVDISGGLYKISQIILSYMHVRIVGDWVGFDYTNDGLVGDVDAQKPSCALICNSGVYAIHIRYNTTGYGYYNILKDFALVSENDVEYGLVVSCAMSGTDNFMVTGFDYGITTFGQNSNLYNRTSVLDNNKIGFVCSAPGTAKAIIAYQHPNLNTYIHANVTTSTLFKFNGIIRSNKFGMVLMNGIDVVVDAVFELNTMSGLVLFKQDGQNLENIDFTHSWFEINYANFLNPGYEASTYSVTGITPLKTSSTEYLKGSVTGEWSNGGYDVGCDILIGSEIESAAALTNRPYNIFFNKNIWGSNSVKGKAFYFRSVYKIFIENMKLSNGDVSDLFRGNSAYCNNIYLSNLTFLGASALTFETNFITNGNFCGEGYNIQIKIPETETDVNIGGNRIMSGNQTGNGVYDFVPRLTTTEKNAISSPTNGMIVYDTTLNKFHSYENGAWVGGGYQTVASATELNLGQSADVVFITGTTSITSIAASSSIAGRTVKLIFEGILTFTDGNNLKLAGNFVTTADDTITITCNGTNWYEVGRSIN